MTADKEFITVGKARILFTFFGQRANLDWIFINKRWLYNGFFNIFIKEQLNDMTYRVMDLIHFDIVFLSQGNGLFITHFLFKVDTRFFLDGFAHRDALKGSFQGNFLSLISNFGRSQNFVGDKIK